jgi:hypothetical protein
MSHEQRTVESIIERLHSTSLLRNEWMAAGKMAWVQAVGSILTDMFSAKENLTHADKWLAFKVADKEYEEAVRHATAGAIAYNRLVVLNRALLDILELKAKLDP